jgi:hypothetical protein
MKKYFLFLLTTSIIITTHGQSIALAADKMNVFYVGIDNPITIVVENSSTKSLIIKTTNGKVTGKNGQYIFRSETVGGAEILVYKKMNHKLIKLGSGYFRIKTIPLPIFKIGSGRRIVSKYELTSQQFVRAELEGFEFDSKFSIESFTVCIVPSDTCKYSTIKNIGGKINDEIRNEFQMLKENDVVVFKNIFAKTPAGIEVDLLPIMIKINK